MIGSLTTEQIEHVLQSGLIGRIGCHNDKHVYIVPVTYVYRDGYVYAHSQEGLKVQMMRKNPKVCFEVDSIEGMTNWRCVVIQGTFEELKTGATQKKAFEILKDRLVPYLLSETMRPKGFENGPHKVEKTQKPVI